MVECRSAASAASGAVSPSFAAARSASPTPKPSAAGLPLYAGALVGVPVTVRRSVSGTGAASSVKSATLAPMVTTT